MKLRLTRTDRELTDRELIKSLPKVAAKLTETEEYRRSAIRECERLTDELNEALEELEAARKLIVEQNNELRRRARNSWRS